MQTVYKYPIQELREIVELELPSCSRILHVYPQRYGICVWALVNPHNKTTEIHRLRIAGTGHPIEGNWRYLTSIHESVFVWHIFEEEECPTA